MFSVKARTRWKSLSFRFHYKFENHISGSLKGWLRVMLQGLVWNECGWFMSLAAELGIVHCFDPGSGACSSKLSLCVEANVNSLRKGLGDLPPWESQGLDCFKCRLYVNSSPVILVQVSLIPCWPDELLCWLQVRIQPELEKPAVKQSKKKLAEIHLCWSSQLSHSPSRGSHCCFAGSQTNRLKSRSVAWMLATSLTNEHLVPFTIKKVCACRPGHWYRRIGPFTPQGCWSFPLMPPGCSLQPYSGNTSSDKKTEYHLNTSDTLGAPTGAPSPAGNFLPCYFPLLITCRCSHSNIPVGDYQRQHGFLATEFPE